jgi:hypothetical protein
MRGLPGRCALLVLLLSGLRLSGQSQEEFSQQHVGRVVDWSYQHTVLSGGLQAADLDAASKEPRLLFHLAERNLVHLSRTGSLLRMEPREPKREVPLLSSRRHKFIDGTDVTRMKKRDLQIDWSLSLGAGVVAAYNFPAKYTFDINAAPSCANDYAVFGLNVPGVTGGQANMVGVNNLYSGANPRLCGANPTITWSYNGSTAAGSVLTSTTISLDGKKVAYVESTAGGAIFHVLAWRAGEGSSATNAAAPTLNGFCTATTSCLKSVTFSSTGTTTLASPWVDYQTDKAFVASDDGKIYRISCVFACAANSQPTVDWTFTLPVAGTGGATLRPNGPVYDFPSGRLFVGDQLGELWVINASTGTPTLNAGPVMVGGGGCTTAHPPGRTGTGADCTASGSSFGIPDSVIMDSSSGSQRIFAFSGNDGTVGASAVVAQLKMDLTSPVRVHVGLGSVANVATNVDLHSGTFDNNYWGASPATGELFMCGTGAADTTPTHYWIGFTSYPTINSTFAGSLQRTNVAGLPCAPYTEIFNPNINLGGTANHHDLLISGLVGAGGNGWIITNDISLGSVPAGLNTVNYPGGISGVIIDNVSTSGQASSVYFSTLGVVNVGGCATLRCAVKLTQLNLQ